MATVASAELEGSSNVTSAWSTDLQAARDRLDAFGKSANESLGKTASGADNAAKGLGMMTGALQQIGAGLSIAALEQLTVKLYEVGAAAAEAKEVLNSLSGGQMPQYINAVTTASTGMISQFDAAQISNRALAYGFVQSADQMRQLTEAAVVLGKVMGKDTTEAENLLIDAIGRGNTRMLAQLGVVEKGKDVTAEINALMKEQPGLTATQAAQMVAFNAVMERANQLKRQGISADEGAEDSAQRLAASWKNLTTATGENIANGMKPSVEWTNTLISTANTLAESRKAERDALLANSKSVAEYNDQLMRLNQSEGLWMVQGTLTEDMFKAQKEALEKATEATVHKADADRRAGMAAREAEAHGIAGEGQASTINDVKDAYTGLVDAVQKYQQVLDQQAGLQVETLNGLDQLTGKGMNAANVFQYGAGILDNYNLSVAQQTQLYQQLGLATGEITQKQIETANGLRELDNMLIAGAISAEQYAASLRAIQGGAEAAAVAQQMIVESAEKTVAALMLTEDHADKAFLKMADAARAAADPVNQAAQEAQMMADSFMQALTNLPEDTKLKLGIDTTVAKANVDALVAGIKGRDDAKLPIDGNSERALAIAKAAVDKISAMVATITITAEDQTGGTAQPHGNAATGGIVGYAGGTVKFPGGVGLVGEQGPELVHLPAGAHIYNNQETRDMLGGQSTTNNLVINITGVHDASSMVEALQDELRVRGMALGQAARV